MFKINRATLLFSVFALCIGCGLFYIKYKVASLNTQASALGKEITKTQTNIRVLSAEMRYLTSPKRLQRLAGRHLNLAQTEIGQLLSVNKYKSQLESKAISNTPDPLQGILVKITSAKDKPKPPSKSPANKVNE